jgi:hypothetical protein
MMQTKLGEQLQDVGTSNDLMCETNLFKNGVNTLNMLRLRKKTTSIPKCSKLIISNSFSSQIAWLIICQHRDRQRAK